MRLVSAYWADFYPFHQLPDVKDLAEVNLPEELKKGDTLIVWGGGDISPSFYNRERSSRGGGSVIPGHRDAVEWALMKQAKELKCPIIGVCRGAQMLCALAGGFLLQDIRGHGGTHEVTTYNGDTFTTNSIHHQMMYPFDVPHEMLASIKQPISTRNYDVENLVVVKEEPEFVYFPEVKGYAVQWHPEMMQAKSPATQFVLNEYVKREASVFH